MSSVVTRLPTGSVELRALASYPLSESTFAELLGVRDVPSLEAARELLDAAFLRTVWELGCPGNAAAEQIFNDRVDALYRQSLLARRPIRLDLFDVRLRSVLLEQAGRAL